MGWIVRPSDADCLLETIAGGKGSSLARLRRMGAPVPAFFIISAAAHRERVPRTDRAFLAELQAALAELSPGARLAVRSSAIGEDAADSSFAGLYHTSLDVTGFDAVLAAIETCWASYSDVAAMKYREQRAERPDGAMAVVVQEMVHGQWSGVSFTANPVSLSLAEGVINSVPGLGEALVSGDVNPEEITLAADGTVRERRGDQRQPLPADAVAAVWKASVDIARQLEFPQDLEWTWRDGRLFILQSRPITTIADVFYSRELEPWRNDPKADPDSESRIWSRMLADETWVSPISPLFYNVHNSTPGRIAFLRSHGDPDVMPPDIFKYHRATAYADVALIRRMYEYQPRLARIRGIRNFLPASMQAAFAAAPWRWRGRLRRILSYEFHQREMRSLFRNYRYVNEQWPSYIEKSDRWFDMDLDALSLEDLRAHQAEVQKEMAAVGPPCAIAVLSHASDLHLLLTGLLGKWCGDSEADGENLYARVSSGLDDSDMLLANDALWDLGRRIRELSPDVVKVASSSTWAQFKPVLLGHPAGGGLVAEFEAFWRKHRHLGSSYKDLVWPRWGDDIELCFAMMKGYIDSRAERPVDIHARSARARRTAQVEVLDSVRGPFAGARRPILRWLFRYNERYMAIRDNHRFYVDRNWYEVRRIYRSYGARLTTSGVLRTRDEVFFLGMAEVQSALEGKLSGEQAARRVEVRRQTWQRTLREQGPKFLRAWAPHEATLPVSSGSVEQELRGIAASPGSAVSVARIVYDVSGLSAVKDGDILITRQTDPSWTTIFGRISGLVLETGGVLSHGTSLCREYGLPCVTAVERATVRIPEGSRIELHGSTGVVRILDSKSGE